MAHAGRIQMHERRARAWIKTNSAALRAQPRSAQLIERNAGNVEIDRLALRVLAELGDPAGFLAKRRIGGRRTIAAHDPDRLFGPDLPMHLPEEVDQMRVHVGRLVLPPIAQQLIDFGQRLLVVAAVDLVGNGEVFVRVNVMQRYGPRLAFGNSGLQALTAKKHEQGSNAAAGAYTDERGSQELMRGCACHVPTPHSNASVLRLRGDAAAGKLHRSARLISR